MRGWLSTTALGLLSAVPLIGHLLAPRRYAQLREWLNRAFLPEPRTELTLMRNTAQSQEAVAGLLMGFAPAEKTERVASVLGPAGLTRGFARLGGRSGPRIDESEQSARIGPRLRSVRGTPGRTQRAALCGHGQPARSARPSRARHRHPARHLVRRRLSRHLQRRRGTLRPGRTSRHASGRSGPRSSSRSTRPGRATPTSAPAGSSRARRCFDRRRRCVTWKSAANISRNRGPSTGIAPMAFAWWGAAA